jgi:NADH:ubiquinone oxidoreductase subunit K
VNVRQHSWLEVNGIGVFLHRNIFRCLSSAGKVLLMKNINNVIFENCFGTQVLAFVTLIIWLATTLEFVTATISVVK